MRTESMGVCNKCGNYLTRKLDSVVAIRKRELAKRELMEQENAHVDSER